MEEEFQNYVKDNFDIALVPKYRNWGQKQKKIIKRNFLKPPTIEDLSEESKQEEITEQEIIEQNKPIVGTLFDPNWSKSFSHYTYPNGEFLVNIPEVYEFANKPKTILDSIFDATKKVEEAITLNENNQRVHNMQNIDQKQFFNTPTKQVIGGMSSIGNFVMPVAPEVGLVFKSPGYIQDIIETWQNPNNMGNWLELGLNTTDAFQFDKIRTLFGFKPRVTSNLELPQWYQRLFNPRSSSIEIIKPNKNTIIDTTISSANDIPQVINGESTIETLLQ